jgi:hypothetical protein
MDTAKSFLYRQIPVSPGGSPGSARKVARRQRQPLPPLTEVKLGDLRIDQMREALRMNLISFPSQVPVFGRHDRPDVQWRFAQLYFVLGWRCGKIAARYGVGRQRAGQILKVWVGRAVETGYVQLIPAPQNPPLATETRDRVEETLISATALLPLSPFDHFVSDPYPAQ